MVARTFEIGEAVRVALSPGSPIWHEARYLGVYTIHIGQRPWHHVQVNYDKHIVPARRIRKAARP